MSSNIVGKVGSLEVKWAKAPIGSSGRAQVSCGKLSQIEIEYQRDETGLWIVFPDRILGFDIVSSKGDLGENLFTLKERLGPTEIRGAAFTQGDMPTAAASGATKKKDVRVRAQMPGRIIKVLVEKGAKVTKGDSLLVMEAMKMENEIKATQDGTIKDIKTEVGKNVESGADLMIISGGNV